MVCIIKCIKCCTDRALSVVNCVGVPGATGLIVAKAYDVPKIEDIEWTYIMFPTMVLVALNVSYYTFCQLLIKKRNGEKNIELSSV